MQTIDLVEIGMLVMTICGVAVSFRLVHTARRRLEVAWVADNRVLVLVAQARLEHERLRGAKQGVMLMLAIYCLTDAPPPPMTPESFVVRIVFILLSMAMLWTSLRAERNDQRIRSAVAGVK